MSKVYVLVDEHGDYSDYTKSVERVYASRERAEAEAARLNALCEERRAANNVVTRHEWDVLWPVVKAEHDECQEKIRTAFESKTYPERYADPEWVRLSNRAQELLNKVSEQVAEFSAATYPQFQDQLDDVSTGLFETDQDYKVEEHDFVEEA